MAPTLFTSCNVLLPQGAVSPWGDPAVKRTATLAASNSRSVALSGAGNMGAACAAGFEGPLGARASEVFAEARRAGLTALDDAAIYRYLANLKSPSAMAAQAAAVPEKQETAEVKGDDSDAPDMVCGVPSTGG